MENNNQSPAMRRATALMAALPEVRQDIQDLLGNLSEADLDRPTLYTSQHTNGQSQTI